MKIRNAFDTAFLSVCGFFVIGSASAVVVGGPTPMPEPGTLGIFGLGIGALYLISRHKRRK